MKRIFTFVATVSSSKRVFFEILKHCEVQLFDIALHFVENKVNFFSCLVYASLDSFRNVVGEFFERIDILEVIFVQKLDDLNNFIDLFRI